MLLPGLYKEKALSKYVIGDVHGCLDTLKHLLQVVSFNPGLDEIWFLGDLASRGPMPLATLDYIQRLGSSAHVILGNHDLYLLAAAHEAVSLSENDPQIEILKSSKRDKTIQWLSKQPLAHYFESERILLVHAGVGPSWTTSETLSLAREVSTCIQEDSLAAAFYQHFLGNHPNVWMDEWQGSDRSRYIVNALTRIRYCERNGALALDEKMPPKEAPSHLIPWYDVADRKTAETKICFGHWASLSGQADNPTVIALDYGCVYGGKLAAYCIDSDEIITVTHQE